MPVQLSQWVFAAEPGHPALADLVEVVAAYAIRSEPLAQNSNLNTLMTTGPGPFTDAVLWHAVLGEVRIVPRHYFGHWQAYIPGTTTFAKPDEPDAFVQHLFLGSWKSAPGPLA